MVHTPPDKAPAPGPAAPAVPDSDGHPRRLHRERSPHPPFAAQPPESCARFSTKDIRTSSPRSRYRQRGFEIFAAFGSCWALCGMDSFELTFHRYFLFVHSFFLKLLYQLCRIGWTKRIVRTNEKCPARPDGCFFCGKGCLLRTRYTFGTSAHARSCMAAVGPQDTSWIWSSSFSSINDDSSLKSVTGAHVFPGSFSKGGSLTLFRHILDTIKTQGSCKIIPWCR